MSKPGVFVREATGLVRSFSWVDAFMVSSASVGFSIFSYASQINYVATANPGADYLISAILGFFLVIPLAVTYTYVTVALPRSGADYVWASRLVNPFLGFFIGFWGWITLTIGLGSDSWIFATAGLPNTLATFGYALNSPSLISLTTYLTTPGPAVAVAIGLLVISFVIGLGIRVFHRAMLVVTALVVLGCIASFVVLASSSHADFVNAVNNYGGTGITYDGVIKSAESTGWSWSGTTWGMTLASIPLGYLLFLFPANCVLVGGEIKNVRKSIPLSVFLTMVFALVVNGIGILLVENVVGYPFIQASMNQPSGAWPLAAPSWAITWVSMLTNNIPLLIIIHLGWLAFFPWWSAALFLMASRYLFALSFDRAFPPMLADINERFHFPMKAAFVIFLVSVFMLFFTAFTSYVGMFLNSTAVGCVTSFIACVGAIVLPYKMKDAARILPGAKWKIPFISIVGALALVVDIIVFYYAVTVPAIGPSTPAAYTLIIVIFLIGMAVFALRSYQLKRQGFNLMAVYSQIPPE
jgi:amino acid transporter